MADSKQLSYYGSAQINNQEQALERNKPHFCPR